jgi:hypothetical protein
MLCLEGKKGIAWLLSGTCKLGGIGSNIMIHIVFMKRLCQTYSAGLPGKKTFIKHFLNNTVTEYKRGSS